MNIVYQGSFLREGLKLLGHTLIEPGFSNDEDINVKLESITCRIDLVLIELWQHRSIPVCLYKCRYTLVAYFIDSPINEFWALELCRLFDHVFVDQLSTVERCKEIGINAKWLPVCVDSSYFRGLGENKVYDIVFVGNTSAERRKRNNLLCLLQKHFSVSIFQNVSVPQMFSLFAQSKIILNENLFSGLTLRVLQGMAAGSLVLTEEGGYGVDRHFQDGEHFICYNPDNIIRKFDAALSSYDSYKAVVANGYKACKQSHTSEARARVLLACIAEKKSFNVKPDEPHRKFFEAKSQYLLKMRFGGILSRVVADFKSLAVAGGRTAAQSLLELGNIAARNNESEKAVYYYTESLKLADDAFVNLKIALLYINSGNIQLASDLIMQAAEKLKNRYAIDCGYIAESLKNCAGQLELFFIIAEIYFACGKIFSLGFLKQFRDIVPDTALEAAFLAWRNTPSSQVMDLLLRCLQDFDLEGELLPELVLAIQHGQLSDSQILRTAEIAKRGYDFELAALIGGSFKKSLRLPRDFRKANFR
jgi:tetratricopeptide (TPR) repeat protein